VIFVTFVLAADDSHGPAIRVRRDPALIRGPSGSGPSHLLMIAAFFMLVLIETGPNPGRELRLDRRVRTDRGGPGGTSNRVPGSDFCGGFVCEQLLLYTIFARARSPVGPGQYRPVDRVLAWAISSLFVKALALGAVVVVIESSFAKLRLYKIPELHGRELSCSRCLAVVNLPVEPSFRGWSAERVRRDRDDHGRPRFAVGVWAAALSGRVGAAAPLCLGSLVVACARCRDRCIWPWRKLAVCARRGHDRAQSAGVPQGIRFVLRNLEIEPRVPSVLGVPERDPDRGRAVLAGVRGSAPSSASGASRRCRSPDCRLPSAGVLVRIPADGATSVRPVAAAGFLVLEKRVFRGEPGDRARSTNHPRAAAPVRVLVGVLVFVVLVQYLAVERTRFGPMSSIGWTG